MSRRPGESGGGRQRRYLLGASLLGLMAMLAVDGVVAWSQWKDRGRHLESAVELVDGQSAMYENFTRRMIAGLDELLLVLGDRLHAGDDPVKLGDFVNDLIDRSPVVEWAALIGPAGEARFSGASASAPESVPLAGACRPGVPRLGVVASPPRDHGPRFLTLCRTFSDKETAIQMGVAIARMAVSFADLREEWAAKLTVSLADGAELFTLEPGGRRMLVRGYRSWNPPLPSDEVEPVSARSVIVGGGGGSGGSGEDGRWLVSEHAVPGYPLVVTVGMPLEGVLGEWRSRAWAWFGALLVLNGTFAALMRGFWCQATRGEEAARRLVASELQASAVFDQAFQVIILLGLDGRVRRINDTAADVLGARASNVVGRALWESLWVSADPDAFEREAGHLKAAINAAAQGGIVRYEARPKVMSSGSSLVFDVVVKPVRGADGAIDGVMLEGRDVTEATRARETLVRSERMAALGGLVAGIAHEINTPIGVATTSASYLAREVKELRQKVEGRSLTTSAMTEFLESAEEAARLTVSNCARAAELVHSFKQVAVDQVGGERRRFKLATYIEEVLLSLRPRLKREPHHMEVECPPELELDTDAGALSHSLTNLIVNALVHAFAPGQVGTLRIAVRHLDDDMVKLVFSDDGVGIPPDLQEKVFDPFFTTRRGAGGSGLGLHIVHTAVTVALGGSLRLVSDEGRGTAFVLTFPRVAPVDDQRLAAG